ncbi:MAG TPA: signal peptidase I [Candidatus Paceibacterota bacterium]|nr:signal peptidase I [Candidatus Paceibacterota bacterium]
MENNNVQINNENNPGKTKLQKNLEGIWDLLKFALIAIIIVIPIRMFIAQPFVVSGESMYPTFNDGEYLIVDEISYILGTPKRGDVIIFRYPNDTKRFFIKRVIGMPNEEIIINNGKVTIKNKEKPEGFVLSEPYLGEKFDTTTSYKTGNNEYFVMGDNRNRSSDSRTWGVLDSKFIIGRAYLRLLPTDNISFLPGHYNEY